MNKFHPSIKERLEKTGKEYERIAVSAIDIQNEIVQFYEDLKEQMLLNTQQNNRQLELEKEKKLSQEELDKRMDKLTHLAKTTAGYISDVKLLTFATKPYVDGILAYRELLLKEMQKLANNVNNKEPSEVIMSHIEKKFLPLPGDLATCRATLDSCLSHLSEIKKLYSAID